MPRKVPQTDAFKFIKNNDLLAERHTADARFASSSRTETMPSKDIRNYGIKKEPANLLSLRDNRFSIHRVPEAKPRLNAIDMLERPRLVNRQSYHKQVIPSIQQ